MGTSRVGFTKSILGFTKSIFANLGFANWRLTKQYSSPGTKRSHFGNSGLLTDASHGSGWGFTKKKIGTEGKFIKIEDHVDFYNGLSHEDMSYLYAKVNDLGVDSAGHTLCTECPTNEKVFLRKSIRRDVLICVICDVVGKITEFRCRPVNTRRVQNIDGQE